MVSKTATGFNLGSRFKSPEMKKECGTAGVKTAGVARA